MRRWILCACASLCTLVSACGSSPAAPAATPPPPQPAQVSGTYSGTFETSNYQPLAVFVTLNQTSAAISGTWAAQSGANGLAGNITGTVDPSSFTGTVTFSINQTSACTGSFNGNASSSGNMTWSSAGFTGNCGLSGGNPLSPRFVLQRR
jgi:hypothetical protein